MQIMMLKPLHITQSAFVTMSLCSIGTAVACICANVKVCLVLLKHNMEQEQAYSTTDLVRVQTTKWERTSRKRRENPCCYLYVLPEKDPWPCPGWGCEGWEWRGPLLCSRNLEALSLGQEPGLSRSRGGNEEGCPQESQVPE